MNITRIIHYNFLFVIMILIISCSKQDIADTTDVLKDLRLTTTLHNNNHKIEVYTTHGNFQTGYNAIFLQIKNEDNTPLTPTVITWQPIMHMMSMNHSCPFSDISSTPQNASVYAGYIIFQMASNDMEYWELILNYTVDGITYTAAEQIQVVPAPKRVVESFQGSDGANYVLALVQPQQPRVAINDMRVVLYKRESMMQYAVANGYTIIIDPRMPGMGNHSSPNNVNLKQDSDSFYNGKLSLTMTGYWKINLQLENAAKEILKGNPISDSNESSSIYFEIEF